MRENDSVERGWNLDSDRGGSDSHPQHFPVAQQVKNPPAKQETQETPVQSLGQGRSPGEGNGNLLQYSCLKNPMDRRPRPVGRKDSDTTENTQHSSPLT